MLEFFDELEKCTICEPKKWVIENTLTSWLKSFVSYVGQGQCGGVALTADGVVPSNDF